MVTEAGKTLKLLKSSEVHILAYLFRNAHAIAKQNEFLMEMRNMWWHFRFLFGQTNLFSVRLIFDMSVVSMLALSSVDHRFVHCSGQTKDYEICTCCFSAKHAALNMLN